MVVLDMGSFKMEPPCAASRKNARPDCNFSRFWQNGGRVGPGKTRLAGRCSFHTSFMLPALETIQSSVAPVVMISANGLLCLAFYNRLSALMNRSRAVNKERFDLATRTAMLAKQEPAERGNRPSAPPGGNPRRGGPSPHGPRLVGPRHTAVLAAVGPLHVGLFLALGLSSVGAKFAWLAVGLFLAGAVVMILGILMAIVDLRAALDALVFEHQEMESGLCPDLQE